MPPDGVRRGAACYALRRKAHRGVRGVNHHSVALPRIAGVARYAPTGDWERRAIPYMPHLHGDVVFRVVALQGTVVRNSLPSR